LYLIVSGKVKATLYGEGGRELILAELREGDFFGEMSLLDGKPRSAMIIALEATEVLVVRRRDFQAILNRNPATGVKIIEALCQRLRETDETIERVVFLATSMRKSWIRGREGEPTGEKEEGGEQVQAQHPYREAFLYLDHLERIARAQPRSGHQFRLIDLINALRALMAWVATSSGPRFGQLAREMGLITAEQIQAAFLIQLEDELQGAPRRRLGEILVAQGILTSDQAEQVGAAAARRRLAS
ncbi:MAG: cyclic nucleotide-binding domain-containing protein, partial [Deltaproteobacteria bacterium]|nr:cyclic nucleotide-binding domain-containing protein [Deltaproteobacteria bacterium]